MFCCWALLILQPFRRFTYVTTHSPTLPSLYLRHRSFSNPSVPSPTSQYILQPFFRFFYVTSSSPNSPGEPPMEGINIWLTYILFLTNKDMLGLPGWVGLPYVLIFRTCPHFQELYYRAGGIFKIDPNVQKLDLSILVLAFERRQERRKYCNRKKFWHRLFMDFHYVSISHFKKMFYKKCPFVCPSVSVIVAEHCA